VHGSYFHLYIIGRGGFQVFDKDPEVEKRYRSTLA
jgi:hypothetical protein